MLADREIERRLHVQRIWSTWSRWISRRMRRARSCLRSPWQHRSWALRSNRLCFEARFALMLRVLGNCALSVSRMNSGKSNTGLRQRQRRYEGWNESILVKQTCMAYRKLKTLNNGPTRPTIVLCSHGNMFVTTDRSYPHTV